MGNRYDTRIKTKLIKWTRGREWYGKVRERRRMIIKVVLVDSETYIIKLIYLSKKGMHIFLWDWQKWKVHIFL